MASSYLAVWQFAGRNSHTKRPRWTRLVTNRCPFYKRWRSCHPRCSVFAAARLLASFALLPQPTAFHFSSSLLYAIAGFSLVPLSVWTVGHYYWLVSFLISKYKLLMLRVNLIVTGNLMLDAFRFLIILAIFMFGFTMVNS